MTDRQLMQQALDALENSVDLVREDAYQAEKLYGNYPTRQGKVNGLKVLADDHEKAITALTERLAQPEQEPVHYGPSSSIFGLAEMILSDCGCSSDYQPLLNRVAERIQGYIDTPPAAQRQWVGLTDEDKQGFWTADQMTQKEWDELFNAIEQRLKEKNT
jgi:hypothetical protein